MKAIVGMVSIPVGVFLLFWSPVETRADEFPLGELVSVLIGLALVGLAVLAIGLPKAAEIEPELDPSDAEAGTAEVTGTDQTGPEEQALWKEIWASPAFVGALRAEGVPLSAIQTVAEEDLGDLGPDFVVSPGALFVADWETFERLDSMPREELESLGFFRDVPPHGLAHLDTHPANPGNPGQGHREPGGDLDPSEPPAGGDEPSGGEREQPPTGPTGPRRRRQSALAGGCGQSIMTRIQSKKTPGPRKPPPTAEESGSPTALSIACTTPGITIALVRTAVPQTRQAG